MRLALESLRLRYISFVRLTGSAFGRQPHQSAPSGKPYERKPDVRSAMRSGTERMAEAAPVRQAEGEQGLDAFRKPVGVCFHSGRRMDAESAGLARQARRTDRSRGRSDYTL